MLDMRGTSATKHQQRAAQRLDSMGRHETPLVMWFLTDLVLGLKLDSRLVKERSRVNVLQRRKNKIANGISCTRYTLYGILRTRAERMEKNGKLINKLPEETSATLSNMDWSDKLAIMIPTGREHIPTIGWSRMADPTTCCAYLFLSFILPCKLVIQRQNSSVPPEMPYSN